MIDTHNLGGRIPVGKNMSPFEIILNSQFKGHNSEFFNSPGLTPIVVVGMLYIISTSLLDQSRDNGVYP